MVDYPLIAVQGPCPGDQAIARANECLRGANGLQGS